MNSDQQKPTVKETRRDVSRLQYPDETSYRRDQLQTRPATDENSYRREQLQTRTATDETSYRRDQLQTRPATDETSCRRKQLHTRPATDETSYRRDQLQTRPAADESSCRRKQLQKLSSNPIFQDLQTTLRSECDAQRRTISPVGVYRPRHHITGYRPSKLDQHAVPPA